MQEMTLIDVTLLLFSQNILYESCQSGSVLFAHKYNEYIEERNEATTFIIPISLFYLQNFLPRQVRVQSQIKVKSS